MSLTPRKRKSKHTHTTSEVKEAAKYETERPPHKPVPAAEVILYSDEETTSTLKDWQSSSDATKIDTDKFDVPPQDVTSEDSGYFVDENLTPPTISATAKETDTATTFKTWIDVTITREDNMSGYVVSYREFGETEWHHIHVEQPESGNPTVSTPELKENTDYEVHTCKITATGKASPWCTTQTVTTKTNDTAPSTPTGLTSSNVIDGVLLEWTAVTATDFSHYKIYYGTTSPPASVAGETSRPYFLWKKKSTEEYETYYFAVSAVDTAGNESAKSTAVSGTPIQVKAVDLSIENRPWTADFKMWEDDTTYQKLYWAASDGTSDATVKFADETTKTITANTTGTTFTANTLYYFYWQDGQSTLQYTTDYSQAVGEGKGLMVVVMVGDNSASPKKRSTILPFNSYSPTIGAGAIAAKSILSDHISSSQIVADHIASGQIKTNHLDAGCVTSEKIYSGAVTTDKLDADAVTAEKIAADAVKAEHIDAGAVNTEHVRFNSLTSDPTYESGKMWWRSDEDQLRFSSGTTINDVAIIPKYPLYGVQAPPENSVINQCFEIDRNDDGIPDFWENISSGSGSISLTTSDSNKGGKCLKLSHGNGLDNPAKIRSTLIPVKPSQKYFFSVDAKRVSGDSSLYAYVYWYERDGSTEAGNFSLSSTISSSWATYSGQTTSPSNAYFARIILVAQSTSSSGEVRYDNVILSELRAAEPTAGTVAATGSFYDSGEYTKTTTGWWEIGTLTVPDELHEVLFARLQGRFLVTRDGLIERVAPLKARIVDDTTEDVLSNVAWSGADNNWTNNTYRFFIWFFTIPKNVAGTTLRFEVYVDCSLGETYKRKLCYASCWGQSPHYHR